MQAQSGIRTRLGSSRIEGCCDIAVLSSHWQTERGRNMPVHHVERPPKITATHHSLSSQLMFRELCVQAIKLGNPNSLANLQWFSISMISKQKPVFLHIRVQIPGDRWNTGIIQPMQGPPQPVHHLSRDSCDLAGETWLAKRIWSLGVPLCSENEEGMRYQRPGPAGNAQTRDGFWWPFQASSLNKTHQDAL